MKRGRRARREPAELLSGRGGYLRVWNLYAKCLRIDALIRMPRNLRTAEGDLRHRMPSLFCSVLLHRSRRSWLHQRVQLIDDTLGAERFVELVEDGQTALGKCGTRDASKAEGGSSQSHGTRSRR